ncbi:MAG: restriction endonuclease subunit S [Bacteroidota bacterium]
MSEWKEMKLQEVLDFGNGKVKPKNQGDIPIYGGNGILGYGDDANYTGETIVIGRVGAYCGAVYYENRPIWVSDNALSAKPKGKNNTKFLYYFLRHNNLNQWAGGSSHPLVTQTLLNSLEFSICSNPNTQTAIASILSSLDDKIELLHRQNTTLEKMAETLFRQWFVEEAKEDWEKFELGQLIEINGGFSYKGEYIGTGEALLLGMGCVSFQDRFLTNGARPYSGDCPEKYLVNPNDLVVATRQQSDNLPILGFPAIIPPEFKGKKVIVGANLYRVKNNTQIDNYLFYLILRSAEYRQHILASSKGSTVRMITKDAIEKYKIAFPPKEGIENLMQLLKPINEKSITNQTQILTLTALQDTLLPKLMRGEVTVEP